MMPKKDIDKRKPKFASANFWGGEVTDKKVVKKYLKTAGMKKCVEKH